MAADLGLKLEEGSAGGGSDGNFTAALGVPTLDGFGAIGDGAHAIHEHVEIDALAPRAATIAGLSGSAREIGGQTARLADLGVRSRRYFRPHQRHDFLHLLRRSPS